MKNFSVSALTGFFLWWWTSFVVVVDGCEYEIESAASLGEYTTIVLGIEDLECEDGENDTFEVVWGVNFNLFVGTDSTTTEIQTSLPDMIIPYVDDSGVLRFKWNKNRPTEIMDDNGNMVHDGIRITFPATGVTTIETSQQGLERSTITRFISIDAGFGDLAEIINNDASYIRVLHGGDRYTQAYPEFPPKNLTIRNTGTGGDIELDSYMGVTLDVSGSTFTGQIKAESMSGIIDMEEGDLKLLSSSQLSIELAGSLTLLFVDSRTPAGCAGVVNNNSTSICDDQSTFNFGVETVRCQIPTGLSNYVCGTGVPDNAHTLGVNIIGFIHILVAAVMVFVLW